MEYYDRTLYELSIEIQGYNSRWEEKWRHTRLIYTLLYNVNVGKGKQKKPQELIPLPGEYEEVNFQRKIAKLKEDAEFLKAITG